MLQKCFFETNLRNYKQLRTLKLTIANESERGANCANVRVHGGNRNRVHFTDFHLKTFHFEISVIAGFFSKKSSYFYKLSLN